MLKRMILCFVVSAILVVALSAPAMAKKFPPPGTPGEPTINLGGSDESPFVIHCGPFGGPISEDVHGAMLLGAGKSEQAGNCQQAPPPRD